MFHVFLHNANQWLSHLLNLNGHWWLVGQITKNIPEIRKEKEQMWLVLLHLHLQLPHFPKDFLWDLQTFKKRNLCP